MGCPGAWRSLSAHTAEHPWALHVGHRQEAVAHGGRARGRNSQATAGLHSCKTFLLKVMKPNGCILSWSSKLLEVGPVTVTVALLWWSRTEQPRSQPSPALPHLFSCWFTPPCEVGLNKQGRKPSAQPFSDDSGTQQLHKITCDGSHCHVEAKLSPARAGGSHFPGPGMPRAVLSPQGTCAWTHTLTHVCPAASSGPSLHMQPRIPMDSSTTA